MLKRKLSFSAYVLPFAAAGLVHLVFPTVAESSDQRKPPAAISKKKHVRAKVAKAGPAPAPLETQRYLALSEVQSLIPDLKISDFANGSNGRIVKLTGLVPHDCASKIRVDSSPSISAKDGTLGFAILDIANDKGDFKSCMVQAPKCSEGAICDSLSSMTKNPIMIDPHKTVTVAYLNHANRDAALDSNFDPVNIEKDPQTFLSDEDKRAIAERIKAQQNAEEAQRLQQAILVCASSRNGLNDARDMVNSPLLDDQIREELLKKIDDQSQRFASQDALSLQKKMQIAIDESKFDQFDDLSDQVYDFLSNHPNAAGKTTTGDKFASLIYQMAAARASADDATEGSINSAEAMLTRALDADTGITMNNKNRATFETALRTEIPKARVQIAYSQFMDDRDKKGPYSRATAQAYKHYTQLAEETDKKLEGQLKSMRCEDRWGAPSEKRDKDQALDQRCSELENEREDLAQTGQAMEVQHAQAMQRAQQNAASRQMAASGVGTQQGAQQAPQQIPMGASYGFPQNGMSTGFGQMSGSQFAPSPYSMPMAMNSSMMPAANGVPTTGVPYYFK